MFNERQRKMSERFIELPKKVVEVPKTFMIAEVFNSIGNSLGLVNFYSDLDELRFLKIEPRFIENTWKEPSTYLRTNIKFANADPSFVPEIVHDLSDAKDKVVDEIKFLGTGVLNKEFVYVIYNANNEPIYFDTSLNSIRIRFGERQLIENKTKCIRFLYSVGTFEKVKILHGLIHSKVVTENMKYKLLFFTRDVLFEEVSAALRRFFDVKDIQKENDEVYFRLLRRSM